MVHIRNCALLLLCVCMVAMLGGCYTVKGAAEGFQKDASKTFTNIMKADKWFRDNLW